jgi:hypothetical protein
MVARGRAGLAAPEVFKLGKELEKGEVTRRRAAQIKLIHNEKADIFPLGLIIWEVFRRELRETTTQDAETCAASMAEGSRPDIPEVWPPELQGLVRDCWSQVQESRPSAAEVVVRLEEMRELCEQMDQSMAQCCAIQ